VCVDGPSENCFPEKCPDDARQLIDTEHMLSDFVQGGHMDESGQIIPNNIAKIVFDPLQDPDREKKQTWNQIIAENFDKVRRILLYFHKLENGYWLFFRLNQQKSDLSSQKKMSRRNMWPIIVFIPISIWKMTKLSFPGINIYCEWTQ